jgi:putative transposase
LPPDEDSRGVSPTAEWTAQQFRMIVPGDQAHRFLVRDRDTIYSEGVDRTLGGMGLVVLRTLVRAPQANGFCERLIGTMLRECLDWLIPLNDQHLRTILREWLRHYNRGRPQASLGPGIPDGGAGAPVLSRHHIPDDHQLVAIPVLGGLHHEYRLERIVA